MATGRFHRKCPHCGGKSGFSIVVLLKGHHDKVMSFSGKMLSEERVGTDDIEGQAICLDCEKLIEVNKLDIRNA